MDDLSSYLLVNRVLDVLESRSNIWVFVIKVGEVLDLSAEDVWLAVERLRIAERVEVDGPDKYGMWRVRLVEGGMRGAL